MQAQGNLDWRHVLYLLSIAPGSNPRCWSTLAVPVRALFQPAYPAEQLIEAQKAQRIALPGCASTMYHSTGVNAGSSMDDDTWVIPLTVTRSFPKATLIT